nr:4-hydroxy-tetrahydrodipicolinate reductase [Lachnospiraceae bacterium]
MVRIIMYGCNGKMGQTITGLVSENPEAEIVAGVDITGEQKNDYPVFKSLSECNVEADVLIDFSSPKALSDVLTNCLKRKLPAVMCTTGYSEEEISKIKEASKEIAVLRSANMSLGVNLLMKLVAEAAKVLAAADFDAEIVEKHHNQKVDAPSGTALALADAVNEALNNEYSYIYDRSGVRKK